MLEAQQAVPAWIMPLSRVWQNLNPDSPKFDIILIDEASQADITALPLLYFGKKIIIVGDDKQVSPAAVGVTAAEITHLQSSTIEGVIKHASLYTMDTSPSGSALGVAERLRITFESPGISSPMVTTSPSSKLPEASLMSETAVHAGIPSVAWPGISMLSYSCPGL